MLCPELRGDEICSLRFQNRCGSTGRARANRAKRRSIRHDQSSDPTVIRLVELDRPDWEFASEAVGRSTAAFSVSTTASDCPEVKTVPPAISQFPRVALTAFAAISGIISKCAIFSSLVE